MPEQTAFIAAPKYRIEVIADNWKHIYDASKRKNRQNQVMKIEA